MNKSLKILVATDSLLVLAAGMFGPIYAIYVEDIGGDLLDASIAWALFSFISGIVIYVMGKLGDKVKEKELMIVAGYVMTAIAYFGYIFINSVFWLFGIQILLGLASAIVTPAFDTVYSSHLDQGKQASQWGAWEGMSQIVTAIGALVGGVMVTLLGFNWLFGIMGSLSLFSGLYILFLPRKVL